MPDDVPSSHLTAPATHASGRAYVVATLACGLTTALTIPLHDWLEPVNTVMLFLLTVVLIAARLGRGPAVLASFMSVGLFDFFYVPPRWSFAVSDTQYVLTFAVMLIVALIISQLTIWLRARAFEAQQTAQRANAMYALASQLAGALMVEQVCEATAHFAKVQLGAQARLMVPGVGRELLPALPDQAPLEPTLAMLAEAAHRQHKGPGAQQLGDDDLLHAVLPLPGSTRSRGVLVLSVPRVMGHKMESERGLLDGLATLVATSLERLHFVNVAHQTQLEMNDERLRGSILSALSHDIRTPLTSLFGLADAMTLMQPPLPEQAQEMAGAVRDQAMRLHRMVSNLLDMARLQSGLQSGQQTGQVALRLEWQPIEEVIGASIQLLGHGLDGHHVRVHLPADLPLLAIDAVLMERVFGNLLENAGKYAPDGSEIQVHAHADAAQGLMRIRVLNEGDGFPADKLDHVFGVFERGLPESSIPGVGLGLSICRAIVEAHGGRIEALNPPQGGAEVRFSLPLGTPPTIEPEAEAIDTQARSS
jgi:two-component system sensor histidine kinase KdpD